MRLISTGKWFTLARILLFAIPLLACGPNWRLAMVTPTPTQPAVAMDVHVNVVYPTATSTPVSTPTGTPTLLPTMTLTPTLTPIVALPSPTPLPLPPTPTPELIGVINLVEPQHEVTLPATVRDFEFKWQWTGSIDCQIPPDYAFELRIWSALPGYAPLPAMDAIQSRPDVACDPTSKQFLYRVDNLKNIAGAQAVAVQTAATGPFLWNVALLRIHPEVKELTVSETRIFHIPSYYVGPWDPSRPTATCLDFAVWLEAQALFLAAGGPAADPNGLDPDGNGVACDELR